MMLRAVRGLGEAIYDDEGNYLMDSSEAGVPTTGLAPYPAAPTGYDASGFVLPIESAIPNVLSPSTLTPISITGQIGAGQTYDQYLATQARNAQSQLTAANSTLATLTAAGASIAQIAMAQSAATSAAKAVSDAKAQQSAQAAAKANPVSGCSVTIMSGVCDSYVYIGGMVAAGLLLMLAMKGGR
jgi:hypothetical protein